MYIKRSNAGKVLDAHTTASTTQPTDSSKLVNFRLSKRNPIMNCENVDLHELDFEDKLNLFEERFGVHSHRGQLAQLVSDDKSLKPSENAPFKLSEGETELRELLMALVSSIPMLRNIAVSSSGNNSDIEFKGKWMRSQVSKAFFKASVRSTIADLQSFQSAQLKRVGDSAGARDAKIRSLKRIVSEKASELEAMQRQCRALDKERYELMEDVDFLTSSVSASKASQASSKTETSKLREENEALQKTNKELDKSLKRSLAERGQLQNAVTQYAEDLDFATCKMEAAELVARQSKENYARLKRRAKAWRASSSSVKVRVKELQEVQDTMLRIMEGAAGRIDKQNVRKNLNDLKEKRSRLVGRIANLLTRKRRSGTRSSDPSSPQGLNTPPAGSKTQNENSSCRGLKEGVTEFAAATSNAYSDAENAPSPGRSLNSRKFFDSLRKLGSDLMKRRSNETSSDTRGSESSWQRRLDMEFVEKSRLAIEKDVELREVISIQEREMRWMEEQLNIAKDRTAELEVNLQKERHKHRVISRSVSHAIGGCVSVNATSSNFTQRNILLDWCEGNANQGINWTPCDESGEWVPREITVERAVERDVDFASNL